MLLTLIIIALVFLIISDVKLQDDFWKDAKRKLKF